MSIALKSQSTIRDVTPWTVLAIGLALVVVNLALMFRHHEPPLAAVEGPRATARPNEVILSEGKYKSAKLDQSSSYETVRIESIPIELGVPGRIEANQDRQVQVRPRASGVVREVKVSLGQNVQKGQPLAVLDSADVGTARLHLRATQRALATARAEGDWKREVARNVAELIPELRKRLDEQHEPHPGATSHSPNASLEKESELMEKQYADRRLGTFRATLMSAAVDFDIAAHEEEKMGYFRRENIVGEHPAYVAKHARESAEAKFRAVLEQAKFDAAYQSRLADQQVKLAESDVIDAGQRLKILGVSEDLRALLARPGANALDTTLNDAADEDVTGYTIASPLNCTVITKSPLAVPSQKIEMNDVLFGLADLSNVWVMANIPESDFSVLPALQQGKIRLQATAYPGRNFDAKVLSVGATVDPLTRTVPMLAETLNTDGLLKIGMFVRIVLDTSTETKAMTVPASAVVEIEGKKGVFMKEENGKNEKEGHAFMFRTVKLGRLSGDRQEITSGLVEGDKLVVREAFTLKSELILQSETGDD